MMAMGMNLIPPKVIEKEVCLEVIGPSRLSLC
jgi:hypothetical protein